MTKPTAAEVEDAQKNLYARQVPIIRVSERTSFKRCIRKWHWGWREGRVSRSTAPQLWFGTGIHLALAEWYCGPGLKRGPHPAETWETFSSEGLKYAKVENLIHGEEMEAKYVEMGTLGRVLMEEYVKLYGKDEHMHIISPEQTWGLDIPWPSDQALYNPEDIAPGELLARHVGTFDLVWRDLRSYEIWLEEHKTAQSVYTGHLTLDDQGATYYTMAYRTLLAQGLIKKTDVFKGVEYNFIRKALPDERPKDADGYHTNKPIKQHYIDAFLEASEIAGISGDTEAELKKLKMDELALMAERQGLTVLGERSKIQPKPLFERYEVHKTKAQRGSTLRAIQDEALHMEAVRTGLLPITKTPQRDCSRFCDFFQACELKDQNGNYEDFLNLGFIVEDPYKNHQKSANEVVG